MAYLIGTDEAGYGPNLGPLVISASVWKAGTCDVDLYACLDNVVKRPDDDATNDHLRIGDSKELYKPGKGLGDLEQAVLAVLTAICGKPGSWKSILAFLAAEDSKCLSELPWYDQFDVELPMASTQANIDRLAERLKECCQNANCEPTQIASRVIAPPQFNALCERLGNKAATLSYATLQLIREVLASLPADEPVYVLCDKHGGRNKYSAILNDVFPESFAMMRKESRQESVYQMSSGTGRREFTFRMKADASFLPSALASMVSKYLRELSMQAFNHFWAAHVDDLKPTAGYPVDAKRFKQDIAAKQAELGIEDTVLWRSR